MPRKNNDAHNRIEIVEFHTYAEGSLVSGKGTVAVAPSSFTRVAALADNYALYRFTELRFRLLPTSAGTNITGAMGVGWLPGVTDTAPNSTIALAECIQSCILSVRATVPTEWVRLTRSDLQGYEPWYKTVAGTPESADEVQGNLFLTGAGTDGYALEVRGTVEFKVGVNTAFTPALKESRDQRERERILRLLAFNNASVDSTPTQSRLRAGVSTTAGLAGKQLPTG